MAAHRSAEYWTEVAYVWQNLTVDPKDLVGGRSEETVRTMALQKHYGVSYGTALSYVRRLRRTGAIS